MFLRITNYKRKKVNFTLLFIYFSLYNFIEIKNQRKIRRQVNRIEMEFNKRYILHVLQNCSKLQIYVAYKSRFPHVLFKNTCSRKSL